MRLTPIDVKSPQDRVAKIIAYELTLNNVDGVSALPLAMKIMGAIQDGIDADDLQKIIDNIREGWKESIHFWETYHPGKNKKNLAQMKHFLEIKDEDL